MPFNRPDSLQWFKDLATLCRAIAVPRGDGSVAYDNVLTHVTTRMKGDCGIFVLLDRDADETKVVAAQGCCAHQAAQAVPPFAHHVIDHVLEQGVSVLSADDRSAEGTTAESGDSGCCLGSMAGSAIGWPVRRGERLIGGLAVCRNRTRRPFTTLDLQNGDVVSSIMAMVLENIYLHAEEEDKIRALSSVHAELSEAQTRLAQVDKMASIGLLAAGVAHEINNPIGFVQSNLGSMESYLKEIFVLLDRYEQAGTDPVKLGAIAELRSSIDLAYLRDDIPALLAESKDGIRRVREIVQNLKDFSHPDTLAEFKLTDLHVGIDSAINIAWNEIKYRAELKKEYGDIPLVMCRPSEINQVILNLLVNASQAIGSHGVISVRTGMKDQMVWIEVADNGAGIPPDVLARVFDPFFTTKPVGTGTGLGLSLSYGIVHKHGGHIAVKSAVGVGTSFKVWLPIEQDTNKVREAV
ncbi:MAG TPA: ATP-binding protein [Chiayiivirga sp.]|nr:ATP-binding protein [Chiayiivirga sp.]